MASNPDKQPLIIGVFASTGAAEAALSQLIEAGFTKDRLSVLCTDQTKQKWLDGIEQTAGSDALSRKSGNMGAAVGAVVGGLTAMAGVTTTGGASLLLGGTLFVLGGWLGDVIGGFVAQGIPPEVAERYDQALTDGKILVAAESPPEKAGESGPRSAPLILRAAGAESIDDFQRRE